MKFSKMIFVLAIAAGVVFVGMMGTSYAYYTATATDIEVTTGTVDNGFSVVFTDNNYVNVKTGVPIDDDVVDTLVTPNTFTITPNQSNLSGYDAYVNISLINVKIDDALKVSDFKYKLKCNNTILASGNGTSLSTGTDISLGTISTTDDSLNINNFYVCNFYVWLHDSEVSQNELMNKKFSGLLKVNTIMRKQ